MSFFKDLHHLFQAGNFGVDHIIGQQYGKGLITYQFARGQHRVTEAERLLLAYVSDVDHVRDLAHNLKQIELFALFEHLFEFVTDVEVIFDSLLAAAGDHDDLIAAGSERFLDAILNDGFVHQRQHFFGLSFGYGQEPRA